MNRLFRLLSRTFATANKFSWTVTAIALFISTALWTTAKISGVAAVKLLPLRAAVQLTGLWGFTLMCITIIAVGRAEALEPVFGGLDRATRFHRIVGPTALFLVLLHPLLLVMQAVRQHFPLAIFLVPFSSPATRSFDIIATYLLLLLVAFAYTRRLKYERWLMIHRPVAMLFLAAAVNFTILEPGTPSGFEPLRTWMILLMLASAGALFYRLFLFKRFGNRYGYSLETVTERPNQTLDLVMRPLTERMMYEPGTFVFIRVRNHGRYSGELHPFSISSTPIDRDLRLSIRMVGDFTKSLSMLTPGHTIDVYGPFGGFTPHRFAQYRRLVFIGAGIGITPFLSILAFEETNHDFRRIWLYYLASDAENAPYDQEILSSYLKADSFIDYFLWESKKRGRLTAADVQKEVQLDNYAVMLCGHPEFVAEMTSQFQELGVPCSRIISEELLFR